MTTDTKRSILEVLFKKEVKMRVISSKRDAAGHNFHYCPKLRITGDASSCDGCAFKDKVEQLQATYRVYCKCALENPVTGMIPSHAEDLGKGKEVLSMAAWSVLEPKLDGARCVLVIDEWGAVHAFTRNVDRFGAQKEITANLPHLQAMYLPDLANSILDSEILVLHGDDATGTLGATMSVVGASPDRAIETQQKYGQAQLYVFDIMRYASADCTKESWSARHEIKQVVVLGLHTEESFFHLMPSHFTSGAQERESLFHSYLNSGALIDGDVVPTEGVVVKNPKLRYLDINAILKCKESVRIDALVTGWEPGKKGGKWENSIGALLLSIIDASDHALREIGKVIPGDDAKRAEMYALLHGKTPTEIGKLGIVLELEGQSWTKEYRIRHPRIVRYRPDVSVPNTIDLSKVERK